MAKAPASDDPRATAGNQPNQPESGRDLGSLRGDGSRIVQPRQSSEVAEATLVDLLRRRIEANQQSIPGAPPQGTRNLQPFRRTEEDKSGAETRSFTDAVRFILERDSVRSSTSASGGSIPNGRDSYVARRRYNLWELTAMLFAVIISDRKMFLRLIALFVCVVPVFVASVMYVGSKMPDHSWELVGVFGIYSASRLIQRLLSRRGR
jgi:hypothetical protein